LLESPIVLDNDVIIVNTDKHRLC